MKNVFIVILISCLIYSCSQKKDEPIPNSYSVDGLKQLIEKDPLGKIKRGQKFYYNSANKLFKIVSLDTNGNEIPSQYVNYIYNSEGKVVKIENNTSFSSEITSFVYTNGLVTTESNSRYYTYGDRTDTNTSVMKYGYNNDRTLKYMIRYGDSTVFKNYNNGNPEMAITYSNDTLSYTLYLKYDANGNIVKNESQNVNKNRNLNSEIIYSNVHYIHNIDPSPRNKFIFGTYLPSIYTEYSLNPSDINIMEYQQEFSNFKFDQSNRLISAVEINKYYDYSTGALENTRKIYLYYTY